MSKIIHLISAGLFTYFAIVQYNDNDGWRWMIIYGAVALIPILKLLNKNNMYSRSYGIGITVALLLALIFNYDSLTNWIDAGKPAFIDYEPTHITEVEQIREYLGLGVSFVVTLLYTVFDKIGRKKT